MGGQYAGLVEGHSVQRFMLKSKIHRARLTGTDLDYEGSITIDRTLLDAADILPGEQVHVLNLNNGQRLVTYAIEAEAGSGTVLLNGPAARLGMAGDLVVILTYAALTDDEARAHRPKVVQVDGHNRPRRK
jgi:aspartate 1-decarboxylase